MATFASHIHRVQQVLKLAERYGRRVALLGMSMEKNVRIASELGYLQVPEHVLLPLEELAELVDAAVAETGASEQRQMGQVMSALMPKLGGRADGKRVSAAVRERLGS